jgi:hypothetical protein
MPVTSGTARGLSIPKRPNARVERAQVLRLACPSVTGGSRKLRRVERLIGRLLFVLAWRLATVLGRLLLVCRLFPGHVSGIEMVLAFRVLAGLLLIRILVVRHQAFLFGPGQLERPIVRPAFAQRLLLLLTLRMRVVGVLTRSLRVLLRARRVLFAFGVIALAVVLGGRTMCLGSVFVVLGGLIMLVSCHEILVGWSAPSVGELAVPANVPIIVHLRMTEGTNRSRFACHALP